MSKPKQRPDKNNVQTNNIFNPKRRAETNNVQTKTMSRTNECPDQYYYYYHYHLYSYTFLVQLRRTIYNVLRSAGRKHPPWM